MLSSLWRDMDISTADITVTVAPTHVPASELIKPPNMPTQRRKYRLPKDFIWGWASTAPQIEGAVKADGRGPSIWDNIVHKVDDFIADDTDFDIANNHYYLYKQDIERLGAIGVKAYSMSVSWSRIFPLGNGTINKKGLQHYVDEVQYLVARNITPIVTLYHWDLPQTLQEWYGGFLSDKIVEDFGNYVRAVFNALAPYVKIWITLNEPQMFCNDYMEWPKEAPDDVFPVHDMDDPLERLYTCGHNALLAHAEAVRIFRQEIVPKHGPGKISFANSWDYTPPYTRKRQDQWASERALDFAAGWFGNPVYINGDYPKSMKKTLGDLLPKFTRKQKNLIKGSADFYAWDSYTGYPVKAATRRMNRCINDKDREDWPVCVEDVHELPGGWPIGAMADEGTPWLYNTPNYFREGVLWSWKKFRPKEYFIPEFGFSVWNEDEMSISQARYDTDRIDYYEGYLNAILGLVNEDKVKLIGAIAWSATDNFEWREGQAVRFGLQYIDYETMERYYKKSAFYFCDFFRHYIR
ncbi:hypothetical protein TRVA0_006S00364 [Trichomonascus vanleenenianus]|uniref:glycoside hydrolase family 1 protein n=1 Tax=Trichomonascus vanleenenianus TaxID=2268995 RepID=UPI003ECAB291